MTPQDYETIQSTFQQAFSPVLSPALPASAYTPIDLSKTNDHLVTLDLSDPKAMEVYISDYCQQQGAEIAYGGYLEPRNLYRRSAHFNQQDPSTERTIHLGIDFWAAAGSVVVAPLAGRVHSFQDNVGLGDYGPTIILAHATTVGTFYTLYGHLSRASLDGLGMGKNIAAGEPLAKLGTAAVNGDYAPHLHFQVVLDVQGKAGDYPGVCSASEVDFYKNNCPDPLLLLGLQ